VTVTSPRLAALTLAALLLACSDGDSGQATAPPRPAARVDASSGPRVDYARVAVIGASVSAGFGGAPLADLLDGALTGTHRIDDASDLFTSRDPETKVAAQVDRALAAQATCVFALDALFWYVYAGWLDGDGRLARLELGLRELERIGVPLILGDIPWMRDASPIFIRPQAIPPADQIERFNARIRAWAADRPHVLVVPFSEWVTPLLRGEAVPERPGGQPVPAAELMSLDKLHPNRRGALYVLRRVDAAVEAAFPGTPADALQPP
jgi:hypothetical protein